jgi:hypothetical protein
MRWPSFQAPGWIRCFITDDRAELLEWQRANKQQVSLAEAAMPPLTVTQTYLRATFAAELSRDMTPRDSISSAELVRRSGGDNGAVVELF